MEERLLWRVIKNKSKKILNLYLCDKFYKSLNDTEEYEMKLSRLNWRLAGAVIALMASFSVNADTRLEQVWTCTLNEGKTLEEFSAIHGKLSLIHI